MFCNVYTLWICWYMNLFLFVLLCFECSFVRVVFIVCFSMITHDKLWEQNIQQTNPTSFSINTFYLAIHCIGRLISPNLFFSLSLYPFLTDSLLNFSKSFSLLFSPIINLSISVVSLLRSLSLSFSLSLYIYIYIYTYIN